MIPFTLHDWYKSTIRLAVDINLLHSKNNLLGPKAKARHEFFFSDFGVPKPRPCTILAWASLCAFGPIQGFKQIWPKNGIIFRPESIDDEPSPYYQNPDNFICNLMPWSPIRGHFMLPFIPALNALDEQESSLPRSSPLHNRDMDGYIDWGKVYIADASSGQIMWQAALDNYNVKEWQDEKPEQNRGWHWNHSNTATGQLDIPPIWAFEDESWQFGLIQRIVSMTIPLRFPMEQMAKNGIPLTERMDRKLFIKKLLIRFIKIEAATAWARAYSNAAHFAFDQAEFERDSNKQDEEIAAMEKARIVKQMTYPELAPKKKAKPKLKIDLSGIDFNKYNESNPTPNRNKG